jgi:hypothetical protein
MNPFAGTRVKAGEEELAMASRRQTPETVERLRADIDRGLTGEKVAASDPAAAPLGSDAEAAGFPPTSSEIELEARARTLPPPTVGRGRTWIGVAAVLALAIALALGLAAATGVGGGG